MNVIAEYLWYTLLEQDPYTIAGVVATIVHLAVTSVWGNIYVTRYTFKAINWLACGFVRWMRKPSKAMLARERMDRMEALVTRMYKDLGIKEV